MHPLFVHRDQRIEGLVWISLLALLVRALLEQQAQQHGLAATADRLCQRLAPLQAVDITWAHGQVERRSIEVTPDQNRLAAHPRLPPTNCLYVMGGRPGVTARQARLPTGARRPSGMTPCVVVGEDDRQTLPVTAASLTCRPGPSRCADELPQPCCGRQGGDCRLVATEP